MPCLKFLGNLQRSPTDHSFQNGRGHAHILVTRSNKMTGLVTLPDSDGVELNKDGVLEEGQHAEHEQEDPSLTTWNLTHA